MLNIEYVLQEQKLPSRWNYKRSDWDRFAMLTDTFCENLKTQHGSMKEMVATLNKAKLQAASESVPRGAMKHYKQYGTEEHILEDIG